MESVRSDRAVKDAMIAHEVLIFAQHAWITHSRSCLNFQSGGEEFENCKECGETFFKWKQAKATYLEKVKEMIG